MTPTTTAARAWGLLQAAAVLAALAFFLRGGSQRAALALALAPAALRLLLAPGWRRGLAGRLGRLWDEANADIGRGAPLPWRAAAVLAALPALLLFLANGKSRGTGDTWPVAPTACGLVSRGTFDLSWALAAAPPAYRVGGDDGLPYCALRRGDAVYSSYPSGVVPFALPAAAVACLAGADPASLRVLDAVEKLTAATLAAATLGLFFLLALHLAPAGPALAVTALLGAASAVWSTCAQGLWQHDGVVFWAVLALLAEFRRAAGRPWRHADLLAGLCCAMTFACRLSAALLVGPLVLWLLLRSPRRALRVAGAAALAYAPWALLHRALYGNPFGPSVGQLAAANWGADGVSEGLAGVLISPARGLLVYQAWLLLGLLGLGRGVGGPPGWRVCCLAAAALHLGLVATWRCWWGGSCWGSRLAADVVPLLALLSVPAAARLWRRPSGRLALAAALLLGVALHGPAQFNNTPRLCERAGPDRHPEKLRWGARPVFVDAFDFWRDGV
jgi:hypothetical protein